MKLKDKHLFREKAYIAGKWQNAIDGESFDVHNPSTGAKIGSVPKMGVMETRHAIEAAEKAFPEWSGRTAKERSQILRRWYDLMLENIEDLAALMTTEQGKPLAESQGEIRYAASFIEWYAEEAKRVYGDIIPSINPRQRQFVMKQPIGVVAAITPWNFPTAMITRKCGPAFAAGCTVVLKPAEATPYSALAMAELAERAGIPPGVLNIVTGDPAKIGGEMTAHPAVRKITFTGSTRVGKLLIEQSAGTVKKLSLELGGSAPFIVFADADLPAAVEGLIASKFRNTGQTCVCADRVFVEERVYDEFAKLLAKAAKKLKVGDGFEPGVQQGPLINQAALDKVEEHVRDAVAKGAQIACGGNSLGKLFFEPTVLTQVSLNMKIAREETFGPVAPLISFKTEEEAIALANDTPYGLASYFFTQSTDRIWRVAEKLEYGIVCANSGIFSNEATPFGGVKQSGLGREGSKYGIEDYLEIKHLCLASKRLITDL